MEATETQVFANGENLAVKKIHGCIFFMLPFLYISQECPARDMNDLMSTPYDLLENKKRAAH